MAVHGAQSRPSGGGTRKVPIGEQKSAAPSAPPAPPSQPNSSQDKPPRPPLFGGRRRRHTAEQPEQGQDAADTVQEHAKSPAETVQKGSKPKKAKPAKPERVAPTDRPLPSRGIGGTAYRFYRAIGRPDLVPPLSRKEQKFLDTQQKADAEALTLQMLEQKTTALLRHLTDRVPTATVAFMNTKGAAATTATTVHEASIFTQETRTVVIVLDANPASGTSAARLGKEFDETLTVNELSEILEHETDFADQFAWFIGKIRPSRYGVRTVSANPIVEGLRRLTVDQFKRILEATKDKCEYLLIDTANDITEPVTLAVAAAADVYVFTANVSVPDSLRQLATTMETLRRQGHAYKVNNGVVVISNLPAGADLDSYRKYLNRVNLRDEVVEEYSFDGQFLGVPHDPEIARDREVNIEALQRETVLAYRQLGIAWLEQVLVGRRGPK